MTRSGSKSFVLHFVERVRGRLVRVALLEAASAAALAALLLVATIVMLAANRPDPTGLRWALFVGGAAIAGALSVICVRAVRRARRPVDVALHVEARVPGLHSGVVSTVEFAAGQPLDDSLSQALVDGLAFRTAERLASVEPSSLVDTSRASRFAGALGLAAAAVCATALLAPGLFVDGLRHLMEGRAEASALEGPDVAVVEANVRDIRFRFVYPAYTRLPDRELLGGGGDITALPGTVVHIRATALRASEEAMLVVGTEQSRLVPLTVEGGVSLAGSLTVQVPTSYRFRLVTRDGMRLDETSSHAVDVDPDNAPEIRILAPEADMEVNEQDQVQLVYQANDDYGLGQVDLVYRRQGHGEPVRRRAQTLDADLRHHGSAALDVAETGARPGETLEVWLEAFDQDTVNGPKTGKSDVRRIKVWSPEEKHEENVDRMNAIAEAMLHVLADRLESPVESLDTDKFMESLGISSKSNSSTEKIVKAIDEVLVGLAEDPLMPATVLTELTAVRDQEDEVRRAEAETLKAALLLDDRHPRQREHLTLLWTHNNDGVDALEDDIMRIEDLVDRLRKDKLMTQTRDLLSQQNELMDLLQKLKDSSDPADIAKAQQQIDALQSQLQQMMEQVAKQAKKMPYDNFNASAIDPEGTQKNVLDFQKELDEIRDLLAQGKVDEAMAKAEALQKMMAELMTTMEQGFEGEMLSTGDPEAQKRMQEVQERLSDVAQQEKRIHEKTSEISEARREAMEQQRHNELSQLLREQREKAEAALQKLGQTSAQQMDPRDQDALDASKERLRELAEALEREDLEQAQQLAEQSAQGLGELAFELRRGADLREEAQRAVSLLDSAGKAGTSGKMAREIAETLDSLRPEPGAMLSPAERQQLSELAEEQRQAGEKLQKLRTEIGEMAGELPGGEGLRELLEEANQSMDDSGERLSEQRPRQAQLSQESAIEKLERAKKRAQQMMQPRPGARQGMGLSHEKAEIPKAEDYQVPAEFRDEVMKAMKETAPRKYEELIERYYEELIR